MATERGAVTIIGESIYKLNFANIHEFLLLFHSAMQEEGILLHVCRSLGRLIRSAMLVQGVEPAWNCWKVGMSNAALHDVF